MIDHSFEDTDFYNTAHYENQEVNNMIKIEIGQYKELNKGALKAAFSVVIYPQGQKILDCKYFTTEDRAWIAFPQKEVKKEGLPTQYIPLISFLNKEYETELKTAVVKALQEKTNGNSSSTNTKSTVQSTPSALWE